MPKKKPTYRVIFHNQGKVYELYARSIGQGDLFGFIEIGEIIFGERSTVLIDPSEERLKAEFEGVHHTYVPLHAVIRIDQVDKQGPNKIHEGGDEKGGDSNVTPFPMPMTSAPGGGGGSDSGGGGGTPTP